MIEWRSTSKHAPTHWVQAVRVDDEIRICVFEGSTGNGTHVYLSEKDALTLASSILEQVNPVANRRPTNG